MQKDIIDKRKIEFDIAKGIAIYLVVIGHLLDQVAGKSMIIITYCHMPVFFFISGYFLCYSIQRHSNRDIVYNKMRILLIPYLFWSGLSFLANVILEYVRNEGSLAKIKIDFLEIVLQARSVWFLIQLFITILVFLGIKYVNDRMGFNLILTLGIGWLLLSVLIPGEFLSFHKYKWLFPFFVIGYFFCKDNKRLEIKSRHHWPVLFVFPVSIICFYNPQAFHAYLTFSYSDIYNIMLGVLYYGISLVGIVFIFYVSAVIKNFRLGSLLADIGKHSVDIYVMHMFLVKFLVIVPQAIRMKENLFAYVYLPIYALCIVLLIWWVSKWVFRKILPYKIIMGVR